MLCKATAKFTHCETIPERNLKGEEFESEITTIKAKKMGVFFPISVPSSKLPTILGFALLQSSKLKPCPPFASDFFPPSVLWGHLISAKKSLKNQHQVVTLMDSRSPPQYSYFLSLLCKHLFKHPINTGFFHPADALFHFFFFLVFWAKAALCNPASH